MRKKSVAYALALMMGVTGVFCGEGIIPTVPTPVVVHANEGVSPSSAGLENDFLSEMKWELDNYTGLREPSLFSFKPKAGYENKHWHEELWCNGERVQGRGGYNEANYTAGEKQYGGVTFDIEDEGSYQFRLGVANTLEEVQSNNYTWSGWSEAYEYHPSNRLPQPTKPLFRSDVQNLITWTNEQTNEHFYGYRIDLYRNGDRNGFAFIHNRELEKDANGSYTYDLTRKFNLELDKNSYSVRVMAVSDNLAVLGNSKPSQLSEEIGLTAASNQAKKVLADAAPNGNKDAITALCTTPNDKQNFANLLQSSNSARSELRQLSAVYAKNHNIKVDAAVSEDSNIDAEKIEVIGAALSAKDNSSIGLKIEKRDSAAYGKSGYTDVYAFEMNLDNNGTKIGELDVPVTIRMPFPEGKKFGDLCILHYLSDGTVEEIIPAREEDGMVRFTITHFSTFAFANKDRTSASSRTGSGSSSSSNSSSSSSSSSVGSSNSSGGGSGSSGKSSYATGKGASKGYYVKTGKGCVCYAASDIGKAKKIVIPATVKIGKRAYKVTSIDANAFTGETKIKSVVVGKNVKKIGKEAFAGCKNLKLIRLKTKRLTRKNIKDSLVGSSVTQVVVMKPAVKKYSAYKNIFTKKVTGSKNKLSVKTK